jgi:hypothetical protein
MTPSTARSGHSVTRGLLLALVISGCGGGTEDTAAPPASPSPTSTVRPGCQDIADSFNMSRQPLLGAATVAEIDTAVTSIVAAMASAQEVGDASVAAMARQVADAARRWLSDARTANPSQIPAGSPVVLNAYSLALNSCGL